MRRVFIGGFGSSECLVDLVAGALSEHYREEVEGLPFRAAAGDQLLVDRFVKGAVVTTHSAGMMVLKGSAPVEIRAVAPPTPRSLAQLIARAIMDAGLLEMQALPSWKRILAANRTLASVALELAFHGPANLRSLPAIGRFDSLGAGVSAAQSGIDVTLGYMARDAFGFGVSVDAAQEAKKTVENKGSGSLAVLSGISGGHNEVLMHPSAVMGAFEPEGGL